MRPENFDKLAWGHTLKPGDIVNDCRYKDLVIKTITPVIYKGEISDYDIIGEDGSSCSLKHCCDHPDHVDPELKTKYGC